MAITKENYCRFSFQVAGSVARFYEFKTDDDCALYGLSVQYLGGSLAVSLSRDEYYVLKDVAPGSSVRVFGYVSPGRSGALTLRASSVQTEKHEGFTEPTLEEEAAGVMFSGSCVVSRPPRSYVDRSGEKINVLDCKVMGGEVSFLRVDDKISEAVSVGQLLEVAGYADVVTFTKDGNELSTVRLNLVSAKKGRVQ